MNVESLEVCLLIGRWDEQLSATLETYPPTKLAKAVVAGDFRTVLTSTYAQQFFSIDPSVSFDQPFERILQWNLPFVTDAQEQELIRLVLGVACLHAFVQANWTGPNLNVTPSDVLVSSISDPLLNSKAISELAYGGEPAYHLAQSAAFFRFAQIILHTDYAHLHYTPWWRLRVAILHEQLLDEPVPLPEALFGPLASVRERAASDPDLAGRLHLEQGLLEHVFSHGKAAAEYFVRAAHATGLQYELTGALGKRTKFQQNALSQLVLLAESRKRDDENVPSAAADADSTTTQNDGPSAPDTLPLNDDTLLEQTEFTSSNPSSTALLRHLDPSSQPPLHPLDQCILLALCLNVRNTSPAHGLTNEHMSSYVSRVISHPRNWSVHTMALLLRARLESTRTRTVERATLQLQALVDQMPTVDAPLTERLLYVHAIPLPSTWEMARELAQRHLSIGVIRSALEAFERLEMWEEAVKCWQAMERPDQALAIVRDLLQGRKEESERVVARAKDMSDARRAVLDGAREAKLWCLLGDLEPEQAVGHYERAWEVSGETSGRAMRSLGGYYFAKGEYVQAVGCLEKAVAINPLLFRPWFILGCTHMRMENWDGAREAFSRCVAIDDEDGESWSNLATAYLRLDEAGQTNDTFSNKVLAFRALKQGLKYRYDNWRMWSNYMVVAVDVGELSEACHAQARIVEERSAKIGVESVDVDVLSRLVDAVTRNPVSDAAQEPNLRGLTRRVLDLFERTILPRVSSSRIWNTYARLLIWQHRWEDALKAYLDGYRCDLAGTFENGDADVEGWHQAVRNVQEIVDVVRNFGPRVEGFNWKYQGRSIVRTFMGRWKDFREEPEWARLLEIQEELRSGE